jgi:hypothetical protein
MSALTVQSIGEEPTAAMRTTTCPQPLWQFKVQSALLSREEIRKHDQLPVANTSDHPEKEKTWHPNLKITG